MQLDLTDEEQDRPRGWADTHDRRRPLPAVAADPDPAGHTRQARAAGRPMSHCRRWSATSRQRKAATGHAVEILPRPADDARQRRGGPRAADHGAGICRHQSSPTPQRWRSATVLRPRARLARPA